MDTEETKVTEAIGNDEVVESSLETKELTSDELLDASEEAEKSNDEDQPIEDAEIVDDQGQEPSGVPTIPQLCVAVGILVLVLGSPYVLKFMHISPASPDHKTQVSFPEPPPMPDVVAKSGFDNISLEAESAYVWDVAGQRALFNKNAQAQLPLASLTKLMTALVAHETYGDNGVVPITLDAISQDGENGFNDGDMWNSKELLDFTLMTSSNDGAYALAAAAGALLEKESGDPEAVFIKKMNAKAEEIGLTHTYFTNPTGLDTSESQSGSYGSARDMAFLMEYIIEHSPQILEHTVETTAQFTDEQGGRFSATNTNQSIKNIENALGSKTGYTTLAGGNLVVAFNAGLNHPIIISVLGSSREGRFSDIEALRKETEALFISTP